MHANGRHFSQLRRSLLVESESDDRFKLRDDSTGSVCIAQLIAGKWALYFCELGAAPWHDLSPSELLHFLSRIAQPPEQPGFLKAFPYETYEETL